MKFEELLKKYELDENKIKSIVKAMSKEKIFITTHENIDERYKKLKSQRDDLENQIKASSNTIKNLKKNNVDDEQLQRIIKKHEDTIKTLKEDSQKKIRSLTIDSAINNLLTKSKAKHSDLLATKFDREKIEIDDQGNVIGLDEQLNDLKKTYKDMFEVSLSGGTPKNPDNKIIIGNSWKDLVSNADSMTAEQIADAYNNIK
ncbi:phage minor structural GP20 [[Clostridium] sordellii]|uniref:phage scaffolding protein n=1 Tax=Paraclostridium sordellii TaxID=1505 RepID=UPI000541C66B|nr:phage scaffolding protein [Paeniclostridium sordellii]MCQ4696507.1 phage scaffolding protein [Paeniclostridium sordellii]MDU2148206.1 phage scaffolding protein [Paeniclostridium sordellii]MDU6482343.1 phage scaffolding protein [Paeniclostridium sordellii]CEK30263.1 phage minor structural GP20 [[Clostridium] sordellii] [Paeniclostridium sordellii]CEK34192.1 phage minor structural GP20,Phage minor structural protein GP20 [[Clostridium] sordellii] [Paeniclostridium sordellii]